MDWRSFLTGTQVSRRVFEEHSFDLVLYVISRKLLWVKYFIIRPKSWTCFLQRWFYFNQHMFVKQVFLCFWMWRQTRSCELVRNMILHQPGWQSLWQERRRHWCSHFELWMRKLGNVCQWVAKNVFIGWIPRVKTLMSHLSFICDMEKSFGTLGSVYLECYNLQFVFVPTLLQKPFNYVFQMKCNTPWQCFL